MDSELILKVENMQFCTWEVFSKLRRAVCMEQSEEDVQEKSCKCINGRPITFESKIDLRSVHRVVFGGEEASMQLLP